MVARALGLVTLSQCYAGGQLTGDYSGGLVGYFRGHIVNCYSRVNLIGDENGGLVGWALSFSETDSSITNAYAACTMVNPSYPGEYMYGFVGDTTNTPVFTSCYWDASTASSAADALITGKTTAQMKTQSSFIGWDFVAIWGISPAINDGYPYFGQSITPPPSPTYGGVDIPSLEAIRNIEMSAMGRFYIDEGGNAVYESRFARNA